MKKKFMFRIELNFLVIFPNTNFFFIKYWEYSSTFWEYRHLFKANIDQKSRKNAKKLIESKRNGKDESIGKSIFFKANTFR